VKIPRTRNPESFWCADSRNGSIPARTGVVIPQKTLDLTPLPNLPAVTPEKDSCLCVSSGTLAAFGHVGLALARRDHPPLKKRSEWLETAMPGSLGNRGDHVDDPSPNLHDLHPMRYRK
jgi:hypothetical protein